MTEPPRPTCSPLGRDATPTPAPRGLEPHPYSRRSDACLSERTLMSQGWTSEPLAAPSNRPGRSRTPKEKPGASVATAARGGTRKRKAVLPVSAGGKNGCCHDPALPRATDRFEAVAPRQNSNGTSTDPEQTILRFL